MALTTELRIFPNKELFAVDMAEIVNTSVPLSGIIQGCAITLNDITGTLSIETGRILINGRLGVITEGGTLAAPTVEGSTSVKCHVVAVCNLSSTLSPFTIEIVNQATYEEYVQQKNATRDVFNVQDGFSYHYLGSVMVNPASGKIETWTPHANANAKKKIDINFNNSGGTYLPAGTNIDTIGAEYSGWWAYDRTNVSGTFPVADNYGTFGHIHGPGGGPNAMQIIRSTSQANTSPLMFMRFRTVKGWGAWQRFISCKLTQLTVTTIPSAYILDGGLANTVAFKKNGCLICRCIIDVTQNVYHGVSFQAGTIANWRAPVKAYASVESNKGAYSPLIISVTEDGKIMVRSDASGGEAAWGTYMCTLVAPASDGYE